MCSLGTNLQELLSSLLLSFRFGCGKSNLSFSFYKLSFLGGLYFGLAQRRPFDFACPQLNVCLCIKSCFVIFKGIAFSIFCLTFDVQKENRQQQNVCFFACLQQQFDLSVRSCVCVN